MFCNSVSFVGLAADVYDIEEICDLPSDETPVLWQYEHLRQFIKELNLLIIMLQGKCTESTCPKMNATNVYDFKCSGHKSGAQDVSDNVVKLSTERGGWWLLSVYHDWLTITLYFLFLKFL